MTMLNKAGFPRPLLSRNGKNTPMPWVSGPGPENDDWALINGERALDADLEKLCIVCGESLTPDFVYLLTHSENWANHRASEIEQMIFGGLPTPTWVHPKCGRLAALYCPHLKNQKYPAMTQSEQKLTHDELAELVKNGHKEHLVES